jgi:uncharacterized protein (TIGR02145 family)
MKKGKRFWFYPLLMGVLLLFTNSCKKEVESETVTDRDGNVYNTVTIGAQTWMAENLKTTRYQNGDLIGTTTSVDLDITNENSPKYQWAYGGNESNVSTYGRLYTWYGVIDSRNVCPTGWHVPTDAEWTSLTTYLGGEGAAGGKLKETATTHWLTPNTDATNETNFTALPGGYRNQNGEFSGIGNYGYWWSSTENTTIAAWNRSMSYGSSSVSRNASFERNGISVRCVKN